MLNRPSHVLFDLDDTLVDHGMAADIAVVAWLEALGVRPTEDVKNVWRAIEKEYWTRWLRGEISKQGLNVGRVEALLLHVGEPAGGRDLGELFEIYVNLYRKSLRLFPDVEPTLDQLRDLEVGIFILTNGQSDLQSEKARAVGLEHLPLLSAEQLGVGKPDPRFFARACDAFRITAASTLHVGDRYELDVQPANMAGLTAVWINRHRSDDAPRRPEEIDSLTDLPERCASDHRATGNGTW